MTHVPSSGLPAGPLGCRGAVLVIVITVVCVLLFIGAIWWMLRDIGAA